MYSAGQIVENAEIKGIEIFNSVDNNYKKIFLKDGNVVGAVLYGDIDDGSRFYNMMKKVNPLKITHLYHCLLKVEKRHRYQLLIWLMMKQFVVVMVLIKVL